MDLACLQGGNGRILDGLGRVMDRAAELEMDEILARRAQCRRPREHSEALLRGLRNSSGELGHRVPRGLGRQRRPHNVAGLALVPPKRALAAGPRTLVLVAQPSVLPPPDDLLGLFAVVGWS